MQTETDTILAGLRDAAKILRDLGGEEEYTAADACEKAARRIESDQDYADQRGDGGPFDTERGKHEVGER